MGDALLLLVLGLAAGVFSGMFGIGGGVIIVPVLIVFLSFAPVTATATSLAALLLPVGIFAVLEYHRKKQVDFRSALLVAAGLITTNLLGAELALALPEVTFKQIYGLFLLYNAWRFIEPLRLLKMAAPAPPASGGREAPWWALLGVGLIAGVLSGMFGIGGGVVIVPMLSGILGVDHKKAVATSLAAQLIPFGLPGVLRYYQEGVLDLWVALPLALGLAVGAIGGARIALNLPSATVKRLYGVFLAAVGVWFIVGPLLGF
jgi:uncharacterized membrane protein YfcA